MLLSAKISMLNKNIKELYELKNFKHEKLRFNLNDTLTILIYTENDIYTIYTLKDNIIIEENIITDKQVIANFKQLFNKNIKKDEFK